MSILLVDNDINIRRMMEIALKDLFRIITVPTADLGLEQLDQAGSIKIVISCHCLPGMSGLDFLRRTAELYPETVRILMTSGSLGISSMNKAILDGDITQYILKPCCIITLREQLQNYLSMPGATGNSACYEPRRAFSN